MAQHPRRVTGDNHFATAGFVLGLLGLVFAVIPFIGLIAMPLVVPGLVCATIGLARAVRYQAPRLSTAAAGLVLSTIGFVVCLVWIAGIAHDISTSAAPGAAEPYQVTSAAHDS
ncbi:hypothetical protein [Amycolatopsis taiwanensis]|uniref:DUF4190 domain-containing protein n=1 Tax=Amycolatopsis taiwanensis TaxID=342230 RepID=A0A9W6R4U7_9PSEU|nr:hypothetical protein [Amycolatopsis taiwanensis]GLY68370.1 hypothetical protein Atai01_49890 [Amycolatopsis taiwanensis]